MSDYRRLADKVVTDEPVHQEIANVERSIVASALTCKFGDTPVVDVLSLNIQPGMVYGFLGPNGAGKTTTLRMLCGLTKPTKGNAYISGVDASRYPIEAQRRLCLTFAEPRLDPKKTAREHMVLQGQLYELSEARAKHRTHQLLKLFELEGLADRWIATYSHGQRQQVEIATAMLIDPDVLVLDEPTNALDIENSMLIRNSLRDFADQGRAVLIATHALGSAEAICDQFGIIQHGQIKASGTLTELQQGTGLEDSASLERVFMKCTGTRELEHPLHTLDWIRKDASSPAQEADLTETAPRRGGILRRIRRLVPGRLGDATGERSCAAEDSASPSQTDSASGSEGSWPDADSREEGSQ